MQQFAIDKAINVVVEALAEDVIKAFWANQGRRVQVYENLENGLEARRAYDRKDSLGYRWEIKSDLKCWYTGNVFVEESVFSSEADYYLIFAQGQPHIIDRHALCALVEAKNTTIAGGDHLKAVGTLIPLLDIKALSLNF